MNLHNAFMDANKKEPSFKQKLNKKFRDNFELYILLLPALAYFLIFHYWPIYGIQIAFKEFNGAFGIEGSPWVGLYHFRNFFQSYFFWTLIKNTLGIALYSIIAGFPIPIILALLLHELSSARYKRIIQTVSYAPFFISTVVMVGIIISFLSPSGGVVNNIISLLGGKPIYFMAQQNYFRHIYVWSGIWQTMGWSAIIYLAALSSIDTEQQQAAEIDGANRIQRIFYINIPGILPTIIILLILSMGSIMNVGFEKIFLMQNPLNAEKSEVISTYVYKRGLLGGEFSFASAVGLFNSVINFIILITANTISKKLDKTSLW